MNSTSTESTTHHSVEVHIPDFTPGGCLLRLVSIFHARGVPVTDLHYTCLPDGSARLSAGFHGSSSQASTLRQTLLRSVHVTDVTLSTARPTSVASAVGL